MPRRRSALIRSAVTLALSTAFSVVAEAQSATTRIDAWNASYSVPGGWRVTQQQGRVHTLVPSTNDQLLYVVAGAYQSFEEVAAELPKAFQLLGITAVPSSQPVSSSVRGMRAMSADYRGQDRMGAPIQSRVTAVLSSHGSGVIVLGFARSVGSGAGSGAAAGAGTIAAAVDAVAQGIEVAGAPVANPQAVAALRGKWWLYSGRADAGSSLRGSSSRSYEETVEFDGAGRFAWSSSAFVSVSAPENAGSAAGANASSDQGTYTVIGTTLVVRGRQGVASYELQLQADRFIADGKTYLRSN